MWKGVGLATALLVSGLPCGSRAQSAARPAAAESDSLAAPQKYFARAALEVTGVNVGIWVFCRYIREGGTNPGFRIGIQSWKDNLLNGFEWDDNQFSTPTVNPSVTAYHSMATLVRFHFRCSGSRSA